ncbi:MAG: PHP domain-containing protein [Candidatus Kerfeldbacteria bacterium]
MEKNIDLHFHSVYSEGDYTVPELLQLAKDNNIHVLAMTDHNVIAGVAELVKLAPDYGIKAIPGVEIYTHFENVPLHLLGYNFDPENKQIKKMIHDLQTDNEKNINNSISNLQQEGFVIDEKKLFKSTSRNFGAIHILKEMELHPENIKKLEKDLGNNFDNFFIKIEKYFGQGRPGYMPLSEIPTDQAIKIIQAGSGFSSLAHPGQQLTYEQDNLILNLVSKGLDAIEVLSPYHNWHQIEHYQKVADKNNLLITGGSDFHGDIDFKKQELIQRQWDYFHVPYKIFEQLNNKITNL